MVTIFQAGLQEFGGVALCWLSAIRLQHAVGGFARFKVSAASSRFVTCCKPRSVAGVSDIVFSVLRIVTS